MKKHILQILSIICCMAIIATMFAGCGSDDDAKNEDNGTTASSSAEGNNEETEAPAVTVENVTTPYSIEGALVQTEEVDGSYFDDAVFVGDSISLKLKYYEASADKLGDAQFLTEGSLSADQLLMPLDKEGTVHVKIDGEPMNLEDAVAELGAKKMYIMLGMNDIGLGMDEGIEHYTTVINNVVAKNPDTKIFVQSCTPRLDPTTTKAITNEKIAEYNNRLVKLCQENGWYFVDVASIMYGDNGCLKAEYCSDPDDMGMHFTDAGCEAWANYLLTHTV